MLPCVSPARRGKSGDIRSRRATTKIIKSGSSDISMPMQHEHNDACTFAGPGAGHGVAGRGTAGSPGGADGCRHAGGGHSISAHKNAARANSLVSLQPAVSSAPCAVMCSQANLDLTESSWCFVSLSPFTLEHTTHTAGLHHARASPASLRRSVCCATPDLASSLDYSSATRYPRWPGGERRSGGCAGRRAIPAAGAGGRVRPGGRGGLAQRRRPRRGGAGAGGCKVLK